LTTTFLNKTLDFAFVLSYINAYINFHLIDFGNVKFSYVRYTTLS